MAVITFMEGTVIVPFQNWLQAKKAYTKLTLWQEGSPFAGMDLCSFGTKPAKYWPRVWNDCLLLPVLGRVTDDIYLLKEMAKCSGLYPRDAEVFLIGGLSLQDLEATNSEPNWPKYNGSKVNVSRLLGKL